MTSFNNTKVIFVYVLQHPDEIIYLLPGILQTADTWSTMSMTPHLKLTLSGLTLQGNNITRTINDINAKEYKDNLLQHRTTAKNNLVEPYKCRC